MNDNRSVHDGEIQLRISGKTGAKEHEWGADLHVRPWVGNSPKRRGTHRCTPAVTGLSSHSRKTRDPNDESER